MRRSFRVLVIGICVAGLSPARALAVPSAPSAAASAVPSASAEPASAKPAPAPTRAPPDVALVRARAGQVRALLGGKLPASVSPEGLLGVPLADERAIAVEVARLRAVLGASDGGAPTASVDGGAAAAGPPADLWGAQRALDGARLEFLSRSALDRGALLEAHAERVAKAETERLAVDAEMTAAETTARDAELERQKVLAAAALARSEAVRLLKEEQARLLALKVAQAEYEGVLAGREKSLGARAETTLSWRRKVASHIDAIQREEATAAQSDVLYDQLRDALRGSRAELRDALAEIVGADTRVPNPGADRLQLGVVEVNRVAYDELRRDVLARAVFLTAKEDSVARLEAAALADQVQSLNRDRLALYAVLTEGYRDRLMGFGTTGIDQGRGEIAQVVETVRYRVVALISWLDTLRKEGTGGLHGFVATLTVTQLLILAAVFGWWRRRGGRFIDALSEAASDGQKALERRASVFWPALRRVRKPAEWWIFIWAALAVAGPEIAETLEMRILWLIASWTLGGVAVVHLIDAVAGGRQSVVRSSIDVDALRFASLRLVGRLVVVFGLVLALSTEMVGRGTLHSWTLFAIWLAVGPLIVFLVSRWRYVIFDRVAPRRNRNALLRWTAASTQGWQSYIAAAVGGAYLIGIGVYRAGRDALLEFTLVRRGLAYLFRRELTRQAEDMELAPLSAAESSHFDPDRRAEAPVIEPLTDAITAIRAVIEQPDGGVVAIVGERGSGKTTLVQQASSGFKETLHVAVGFDGYAGVREQLCDALGLERTAGDEELLTVLSSKGGIIAVDAAHRLIRSRVGGFSDLDQLLDLARRASRANTWMVVFDDSVFDLVERARGLHPSFDLVLKISPWGEEDLRRLVVGRSEAAGLSVRFDHLVRDHVRGDDVDRDERLQRAEEGYFRLLWDFSAGNPGVALDMWRRALGRDDLGVLRAGLIHAFSTGELEKLPDTAAFVLRALVRLEPAGQEQIAQMTHTPRADVEALIQHGTHRGYLEYVGDELRVRWEWFRPIRRVLERRHLLTEAR